MKWWKIQSSNLGKALFSRNQVICLKNLKLGPAPTTVEFNIFAEILHTFPSYLQKGVWFFLILINLISVSV